jgi:hypothetical protein
LIEAPSIVGETLTALPPGPLWRSDPHTTLDVKLRGGVLSSVPPESALAGANALALLDADGAVEIVTVSRVELIGERMFRLSGFVRGIAGSEPAASRTLAAGSRVVVLDGAAVPLTSDISELGLTRRYRIGPVQADVGDSTMADIKASVTGVALVPLAPVRPSARRTEEGVALDWIRRTRIDGDSWDIAEVPLGEEGEAYEVTVRDDAELLRSARTATPSWLYPSALELADFGAPQAEIDLALVQISAITGRGREWRGRITVR